MSPWVSVGVGFLWVWAGRDLARRGAVHPGFLLLIPLVLVSPGLSKYSSVHVLCHLALLLGCRGPHDARDAHVNKFRLGGASRPPHVGTLGPMLSRGLLVAPAPSLGGFASLLGPGAQNLDFSMAGLGKGPFSWHFWVRSFASVRSF